MNPVLPFLFYLTMSAGIIWFLLKRSSLLRPWQAILFFLLKVALGCAYGYVFAEVYGGDDTWLYHRQSLDEYAMLREDPWKFFREIFTHGYRNNQAPEIFGAGANYWKDLEYNLLIKMLGLFNVLSGGHYYVNVIFFNVVSFWGSFWMYRAFVRLFPNYRVTLMLLFFVFIPLVFWTSGIRKDGMIWLFTGLLFDRLSRYEERRLDVRFVLPALIACFFLFAYRNHQVLVLLPVLVAWILCSLWKLRPFRVFLSVILVSVGLFFLSSSTGPIDLPQKVADRQHTFLTLKGGSFLPMDSLKATPGGYLSLFPQAVNHAFVRPWWHEIGGPLQAAAFLENLFVLAVIVLAIWRRRRDWKGLMQKPFILAVLTYVLGNYLIIGYIIPFSGAIVRYRVVYEAMLLALLVVLIDPNWQARKRPISGLEK